MASSAPFGTDLNVSAPLRPKKTSTVNMTVDQPRVINPVPLADATNTTQKLATTSTKPLPAHLRPSLAFPSSSVLRQSEFLLQQQKMDGERRVALGLSDETIMNLPEKQWDLSSNTLTQTTGYLPQSVDHSITRSTAINAETLLTAKVPLPDRFQAGAAELYQQSHPAKTQSPLYRTTNHQYGVRAPNDTELPKNYFANHHSFTKEFGGGMQRNASLVTAMQGNKVSGGGGIMGKSQFGLG